MTNGELTRSRDQQTSVLAIAANNENISNQDIGRQLAAKNMQTKEGFIINLDTGLSPNWELMGDVRPISN